MDPQALAQMAWAEPMYCVNQSFNAIFKHDLLLLRLEPTMNNQQFRSLLLSNSQKKDGAAAAAVSTAASPPTTRPSATPALGARKRSAAFFPMTPRQVGRRHSGSAEFARQLAERNNNGKQPGSGTQQKKFKSSLPKGVKLAAGYRDRTKDREGGREGEGEGEEDDEGGKQNEVAQRVKALEEAMKEGQINRETFDHLVQEIAGGDLSATHLVKGLDRKLLEKVRKGEVSLAERATKGGRTGTPGSEAEDELDELVQQDIAPVVREKVEKKGERAPPPPVAGVKRSRDAILAELKAQRKAAAEAAAAEHAKKYPSLGPGFRKVGPGGETTRIEIDASGREVLIITDANGKEKRKVRKQQVQQPEVERGHDVEEEPLHLKQDTPPPPQKHDSEDDDDDIFAGVGSNYNPLAAIQGDGEDDASSDDEEEDDQAVAIADKGPNAEEAGKEEEGEAAPPEESSVESKVSTEPAVSRPRRNYFNDTPAAGKEREKDAADATVLAALKKVRTLDVSSSLLQDSEEARLAKRAAELAARDRDMDDLDLGFGASRFEDAEEMEMEGEKVKFSEWKGLGADDDEDDGSHRGGPSKKRKRGGKKKKGGKNSVADVLKVMERQKSAKTLG
ncbi:uncharacterized protein EI97DRAFT_435621 [Westerdykella ornata]|uniref:RED-like N-terminal domain-containing protein n=1 Tax=Westerdykella ornata TaxID=318751 RepID=A0A6A6JCH0_WESOR|nr:uncharacterized protein EI97DRAFT_435621 [Westerdykella ornata]KAF2273975.1 hypothetical protein EI97DRAFT_435621 [Westerdykella ornata]